MVTARYRLKKKETRKTRKSKRGGNLFQTSARRSSRRSSRSPIRGSPISPIRTSDTASFIEMKKRKMNRFSFNNNESIQNDEIEAKKRYDSIAKHITILPITLACADSNVCLALGTFSKEIKEYFDNFTNFKYVNKNKNIKRIGNVSVNGFVNEIEYINGDYKSYAILKSSKIEIADNLMYEYRVGQYINELNKQYPCFLETYGLYKYAPIPGIYNRNAWDMMQRREKPVTVLENLQEITNIDYLLACNESKYLAILIQHLKNINSLEDLLDDQDFVEDELMGVLFQLYSVLSNLKETFTHYDLHLTNLYLYEPVPGKCIEYHYYMTPDGNPITFKSKYILKIIDYGRSYFNDGQMNSKNIYDTICKIKSCEPDCGNDFGFGWLDANKPIEKNNYLISQRKNESHDLRVLNEIKKKAYPRIPSFYGISNHLTYDLKQLINKVTYTYRYGTQEITESGYPDEIFNVSDAMKCIMDHVTSPKYKKNNEYIYKYLKKIGDLHVYMDGKPMEFVKSA